MLDPNQTRANEIPSLYAEFQQMPDARADQGKRFPLPALLTLACVALLCGYRNPHAISEWVANYGTSYLARFGFSGDQPPSKSTWYRVLGGLMWEALEDRVAHWGLQVLQVLEDHSTLTGIALDGKTLRGSQKQGAAESHWLSAVVQHLGLTLRQIAVPDKTNEIGAVLDLLSHLVVRGHVFTTDALLTQRKLAQAILEQEGDYVFIVKDNQPQLREDIELLFTSPSPREPEAHASVAQTVEAGHGRIERRCLRTSTALNDYVEWPGVAQVFQLERRVITKRTGAVRSETVYGITSLAATEAPAAQLLTLVRQHWHIENKSPWVRAVTFAEEHSQVRQGRLPQVMATLRNTVISLLRAQGFQQIAKALRYFAARPDEALRLVGITA